MTLNYIDFVKRHQCAFFHIPRFSLLNLKMYNIGSKIYAPSYEPTLDQGWIKRNKGQLESCVGTAPVQTTDTVCVMAPPNKGYFAGFAVQSPFDPYDRKRSLKISFGRCFDNMVYERKFDSLDTVLESLVDSCNDRMRSNTILSITKDEFLPYMAKICGNLSVVFGDDWRGV